MLARPTLTLAAWPIVARLTGERPPIGGRPPAYPPTFCIHGETTLLHVEFSSRACLLALSPYVGPRIGSVRRL